MAVPVAQPVAPSGRLARNIAALAGGQVVTWALTLLWTLFVPRALGPAAMGQLTIATAATGVLSSVISLGIATLMIKEIARDHSRAPSLVGSAILLRVLCILPAALIVAVYLRLLHADRELTMVMVLATASMFLALFAGPITAAMQGMEQMELPTYTNVINRAATAVGGVALVMIGFHLVSLMVLGVVAAAVVLVLNAIWARPYYRIAWSVDWRDMWRLAVDSLPYFMNVLILTTYMWLDSVMLSFMTSSTVVGWYGVPTKVFSTLLFLPTMLGTAWFPRMAAAAARGERDLARISRPALEIVLVVSLPIAVGTTLVAARLTHGLFGPAYNASAPVLVILALALPATYVNIVGYQILVADNLQKAWLKVMIAATIINPLLNLGMIAYASARWHNGAIGAALSLLATEVLMAGAAFWLLPRILDRSSASRLARTVLATAVMALFVLLATRLGLVAQVATGAVVFVGLGWLLRLLTPAETAEVRALAGRVLARLPGRGGRPA